MQLCRCDHDELDFLPGVNTENAIYESFLNSWSAGLVDFTTGQVPGKMPVVFS